MHEDIISKTGIGISLNSQTISSDTDTTGSVLDTRGYDSMQIINTVGAVTLGDVSISAVYEDDAVGMGTKTLVPTGRLYGNTLVGTLLDTANTQSRIGIVAHKRYVQITYTTANSANLAIGSTVLYGDPDIAGTVTTGY